MDHYRVPRRVKNKNRRYRNVATKMTESVSVEVALTEIIASMPTDHPHLEKAAVSLTCAHCSDCRLESEPSCGCGPVIEEYGTLSCSCCGYSYMDCRGERVNPTTALSIIYCEQYGWWIRKPCHACSPKFVTKMHVVQTLDRLNYDANKDADWDIYW